MSISIDATTQDGLVPVGLLAGRGALLARYRGLHPNLTPGGAETALPRRSTAGP